MNDRRTVRGMIELVVEGGTDRAVGERADLDGARCGGLQTCDTERPRQPQDAEAGSEALLRMGSLLQDEIAERCGCRADEGGVPTDATDGPVGRFQDREVSSFLTLSVSDRHRCPPAGKRPSDSLHS
jgi:hypothetical protein